MKIITWILSWFRKPTYKITNYELKELPTRPMPSNLLPEINLVVETEVISAKTRKLKGTWTNDIDDEWPVYAVDEQLTWDQKHDDRHFPRDNEGKLARHFEITNPQEGLKVVWKGTFLDHLWNDGVIRSYENAWYVEMPNEPGVWARLKMSTKADIYVMTNVSYWKPNLFQK